MLLANGELGVRQKVLRLQSGDTRVIQLENKTSPEFLQLRRAYRDAAKRAAKQSTELAPLSHRIGWMHVPKSGNNPNALTLTLALKPS